MLAVDQDGFPAAQMLPDKLDARVDHRHRRRLHVRGRQMEEVDPCLTQPFLVVAILAAQIHHGRHPVLPQRIPAALPTPPRRGSTPSTWAAYGRRPTISSAIIPAPSFAASPASCPTSPARLCSTSAATRVSMGSR